MFDTSRLVPEARVIVAAAAASYLRHTQPWFIGLVVHGSVLKGGFIPECSDIDFQLYLDEHAFGSSHDLPFATYLAIQRDLAQIDLAPFRYIQGKAFSTVLPSDHTGPVPGAYLLLAGKLPVAEATKDQLWQSARSRIATLNPLPPYLVGSLLEHGKGRLAWNIRWLHQLLTCSDHQNLKEFLPCCTMALRARYAMGTRSNNVICETFSFFSLCMFRCFRQRDSLPPKHPLIPKTNRRENQRYLAENTADLISSPVHNRIGHLPLRHPHTHTTPASQYTCYSCYSEPTRLTYICHTARLSYDVLALTA